MTFIGHFDQKVDEKNRIIIPTKYRNSLGENAIITIGYDKCLVIYTGEGFENLQTKLLEFSDTKSDSRMHVKAIAGNATECGFDTHGRVTIPQYLLDYAKIGKEIVIAGNLDHLEVWAKDAWDEYNAKALQSFDEIAEKF